MKEKNWANKIKNNLIQFFKELDETAQKCGRKSSDIQVLFATKYITKEQFVTFLALLKQLDIQNSLIGENRIQDATGKFSFARRDLANTRRILFGNLQKNKINKAIEYFDEIHSIDSAEIAREVDIRLKRIGKKMPIFLEVNVSGEETKHGILLRVEPLSGYNPLDKIIKEIKKLSSLEVKGLMTMAPFTNDENMIRNVFRTLRTLTNRYKLKTSMGMSHDWRIAVEEGSDIVRIGSRIFGENKNSVV